MSKRPTIAPELSGLPHLPVDSLKELQGNFKELTAREYNKLKRVILKHNIIVPFFVWKETGQLIDGHQRRRVFLNEGWLMDVPVVYISAPDERDAKAKLLAISSQYGKVTQEGWDAFTWDMPDASEWAQFDALPFVFGNFAEPEEPAGVDAEPQVNRAEELREEWGTETGQLWRLPSRTAGQEHRLICGDCTDAAVVERVMGGESADIALIDPPYGMRLNADFSGMVNNLKFAQEKGVKRGRAYNNVIGDHSDYDAGPLLSLIDGITEQIWFGANYYSSTLPDTEHQGAWLVWDKRLDESADKMFGSCFELMWSNTSHKQDILRHKWAGIFGTEQEPVRGRVHPNQKPVQLYTDLLTRYGGAIAIDPYAGSGNVIIAAENLSRQCRAIEIAPGYVAVALQRYLDAFGIRAELVADA